MAIIVLVSAEHEETHDCVSVSPWPRSLSPGASMLVSLVQGHHCCRSSLHSLVTMYWCVTGLSPGQWLSLTVTNVTVSTHSTALINTVCQWCVSSSLSVLPPATQPLQPLPPHTNNQHQDCILPQTLLFLVLVTIYVK